MNPDFDPLKFLGQLQDQQLMMSKAIAGLTASHNNLNERIFNLEQAYIRACQQKVKDNIDDNADT